MTSEEQAGGVGENISLALLGRDRALFIPTVFYDDGLVDRAVDAERWRDAVHADAVIVTQWNDGVEDAAGSVWRPARVRCRRPCGRCWTLFMSGRDTGCWKSALVQGYTAALLRDRVRAHRPCCLRRGRRGPRRYRAGEPRRGGRRRPGRHR
ncbi:hypothetical protein ACU686_37975 [Yinghuangia aomiensis]